ncbi:MAG: glycoside hydrolase family 65 protein [Ruminococcaceae bacterium]|nr:glycoside hydrolase family 65 protein [Oscillospiraceae bacterium]
MTIHTTKKWGEFSPPAYVANGFIGFRFYKNPFSGVLGILAGVTALKNTADVEAMVVIPTPKLTFIKDNIELIPETLSQSYDFSNGEFTTKAKLGETELDYTVYTSKTQPTLLNSHLTFRGDEKIIMRVSYEIMKTYEDMASELKYWPAAKHHDGKCLLISSDRTTSAGISFRLYGAETKNDTGDLSCEAVIEPTPDGHEIQLVTSYVPSVMHTEPHNQAQRMIGLAHWQGLDKIREDNRETWAKLWESRITIDGAGDEWQDAIDASFFYLFSSVSEFSPTSTAPYGLSDADMYDGHCFWDTESFMFMAPLFFSPKVARSMLDYRFKRIDMAAANARLNGYLGIQFPWQSGGSGSEVTPPGCSQAGEQHVNLDIALAFDGYVRVTGDDGYAREAVWPVMKGVSEWIESRVKKTSRGYEILNITGIDEETDNVNNDSYSNLMCAKVLRAAADYSEKFGFGKRPYWREIADKLYIPVDENGILLQYEGIKMTDRQVPTVLMSYFPYGAFVGDVGKTLEHYIKNGMEEYCRYPMLSGFLGVFPAWTGDRETALKFYELANLTFFCEPFHASAEWSIKDPAERENPSKPIRTNFITARGSLLSGLIMGLTKMCPWTDDIDAPVESWFGEDIVLPDGWSKITIGKVYLKGKAYRITAENGAERALLEMIDE